MIDFTDKKQNVNLTNQEFNEKVREKNTRRTGKYYARDF